MKINSNGKVLTVFVVIIGILLLSLTSITVFFLNEEKSKREVVEVKLEKIQESETKLTKDLKDREEELKETKKQAFLLEEKNKEADEKINSLLDELELEKGLREEMKKETLALKQQVEESTKIKEELKTAQDTVKDLQTKLTTEISLKEELQLKVSNLETAAATKVLDQNLDQLEAKANEGVVEQAVTVDEEDPAEGFKQEINNTTAQQVELEKIVVSPDSSTAKGRILSVDADTEFVIVNLGEKDGIQMGNIMSVFRGQDYLGDIQVTRVQPEMSAADLVPPFSTQFVRKNDEVVLKQ